ncbi:ROK family protein [Clostridium tertium]|uniref:ROK family protein n=1 Tax=Clostridium tertium TaxID=1559 RepID=UPI00232CE755|nr:ROK family protein [Clostridium tertium]MDB1943243.1 ROK family protein [Clostridium tertium]MDB1950344.1 ROK family protein [Clostridium tertium]
MKKIAGKPKELKNVNTSLIMNSIRARGNATRAEISKDTGLSHTTVRVILNELIEMNEILSVGLDESSGGRRAERYKMNSNKRYIIAISIEEDKTVYRIVNSLGEVLKEKIKEINSLEDIKTIANTIEALYEVYHNIEGIGISVPGVVTNDGYLSGIKIEDWKEIKIKKYLREKFNVPILLENDINSASLAFYNDYIEENKVGPISLVYVSFTSLGVGSGVILNGNVLRGDNGYAGEIGFIPVRDTFLNTMLMSNLNDDEYIHVIINTIKTISAIINPSVVVLGGSSFKYHLKNEIVDRYNKEFNIKTKIIIQDKHCNYSLEGIKEEALRLINKEVKLIRN